MQVLENEGIYVKNPQLMQTL